VGVYLLSVVNGSYWHRLWVARMVISLNRLKWGGGGLVLGLRGSLIMECYGCAILFFYGITLDPENI
jgi:hypothetical protein